MTPDQMDALDDSTWMGCLDLMDAEAASIQAAADRRKRA